MADALVSVILEQFASILRQEVEQQVKLVVDVKKEVAKLTDNFKAIKAVLEDAEERQVKEASVRLWLDNLKDVSCEMEDVLDEWKTELLKLQIEKNEQEGENAPSIIKKKKKVCFCIPTTCLSFGQVSRVIIGRRDIALKIKELNERLVVIDNQRQNYNFQNIKRGNEQFERTKTSSFVGKTFGREYEKETLVSKLLSESSDEASSGLLVIPIVGMGGIGKTTLAQLACSDEKVKTHFDPIIWVCVSDPFDEIRIAKAIIESVEGKGSPNSNELDSLLKSICKLLGGKKFLLVLDDVWSHDYTKWEKLKLPLQAGAIGSKILVTTRKEEVAMTMGATIGIIHLNELSEQSCWSLFYDIALVDRRRDEYSKGLETIGKEIVKKCKGLPLAAKTLGGLMRYKKTKEEWKDVLKSKIWELQEVEQQVFQPLLLSYYDLTPPLKRCLLYCAIFPKDYEFDKDNLIKWWMSQDYLNLNANEEKEIVGRRYLENLIMRSWFQDVEEDYISFKMHDIVHDFLQFMTKNECLIMEVDGVDHKNIRHLTFMFEIAPNGPLPVSFDSMKNLRTLAMRNSKVTSLHLKVIIQLKRLRALDLSDNWIEEIPKDICGLVHLRYLDLSANPLKKLPDTVGNLYNLQTLQLNETGLDTLPAAVGKLINLRHLHTASLMLTLLKLPKAIARLTGLRTLDHHIGVGGDEDNDAFKLGDLRNMDQLQGSLSIYIKSNCKDASEAEKAQLVNKKHLRSLQLWLPSRVILNALQPKPNLESLYIYGYSDTVFRPNWMSLNNLRSLVLNRCHCEEWEGVAGWSEEDPPITIMPCLSSLQIFDCSGLKTLPDFLRKTPLQNLTISDCEILAPECQKGRGKEWHKISHVPNIKIDGEFVQKDGVWIQHVYSRR